MRILLAFASLTVSTIAQAQGTAADSTDPVREMVARLDLEKYKATVKGLTQFGDRRQGTKRNRDAVDWIEAQLKSYGCTNTERIKYEWPRPAPRGGGAGRGAAAADTAAGRRGGGAGGGRSNIGPITGVVSGSGGSRLRGNRGAPG